MMTTYLRDAQFHARKIDHYHAHAGAAGYAQARHHLSALGELLGRAHRSKRGKRDVPVIQAIIAGAQVKMERMKEREKRAADP